MFQKLSHKLSHMLSQKVKLQAELLQKSYDCFKVESLMQ